MKTINSFKDIFDTCNWDETQQSILAKTETDVLRALESDKVSTEDFKALISPAAMPFLEPILQKSRAKTLKRFGNTIQLYTPLYLSNECTNVCTYCGFSFNNNIRRKILTPDEIIKEAKAIKSMGFDHVLLVSGEANGKVGVNYFLEAIRLISPFFSTISIEVQPLAEEGYQALHQSGVYSVLVYQETYRKDNYRNYHTKGKKSNFDYRLETPDRIGKAGIHKIGLGVLLGLEDWRTDSFFCALHLDYLSKKYWRTKYSVSFPRIRPAEGVSMNGAHIADRELVQLIAAYRIFNEDIELSISTRESEKFRDNIIRLGITTMSAGSKTNPGGYAVEPESLEQFEIDDARSPAEVAEMIKSKGYEPVWKDWERFSDRNKLSNPATIHA